MMPTQPENVFRVITKKAIIRNTNITIITTIVTDIPIIMVTADTAGINKLPFAFSIRN